VLGENIGGAMIGLAPNIWYPTLALVLIGISSSPFHPQALAGVRRLSGTRLGYGDLPYLFGPRLT
jgi:MFS transporter, FSR family, fosmidomycin resistance protein